MTNSEQSFDRIGAVGEPIYVSAADLAGAMKTAARVTVKHAIVDGPVDVSDQNCAGVIRIESTVFSGRFHARGARFTRTLRLAESTFEKGLDLYDAHIDGSLILGGATVKGTTNIAQATIAGDLILNGSHLQKVVGEDYALILDGAKVRNLSCVSLPGIPTVLEGAVRMIKVEIAGVADFSGVLIKACDHMGIALGLDYSQIGDIHIFADEIEQTKINGSVRLIGVRVTGRVILQGLLVTGKDDEGNALRMDGASIGFLRCARDENFKSEFHGAVRLTGAKIEGQAVLDGVHITVSNPAGDALALDGLQVPYLRCSDHGADKSSICGAVSMKGVKIPGEVDLRGLKVTKADQDGNALKLDGSEVGSLFCDSTAENRTEFNGAIRLAGTRVARQVVLRGLHIVGSNKEGSAIDMEGVTIGLNLFCGTNSDESGECTGGLRLAFARVASAEFYFSSTNHPNQVNLVCATVENLTIVGTLPETAAMPIEADHFTFARLNVRHLNVENTGKIADNHYTPSVIEEAPSKTNVGSNGTQEQILRLLRQVVFSTRFYLRVESWLRDGGEDAIANRVYLSMRRKQLKRTTWHLRLPQEVSLWIYGDGIRKWPAFILALAVLAFSCIIFFGPDAIHRPSPLGGFTQRQASSTPNQPKDHDLTDAFWVAMREELPFVSLPSGNEWILSGKIIKWPWNLRIIYKTYASIVILASWLGIPLLVASFTGLLKRQK